MLDVVLPTVAVFTPLGAFFCFLWRSVALQRRQEKAAAARARVRDAAFTVPLETDDGLWLRWHARLALYPDDDPGPRTRIPTGDGTWL